MKKTLKIIVPASLWQLLRQLKNSPGLVRDAFGYYQMYGLQETWRKIKLTNLRRNTDTRNQGLNSALKLKDYVVAEPVLLSTTKLKIAVVIHVFYLDMLPQILKYVLSIPYNYSLYFTVSQENQPRLLELLKSFAADYEIVVCPGYGYDLAPFVDLLPELKKQNIDILCKIHTKKGTANLESRLDGIDNMWFGMLLDPLLGSVETVRKIIRTFESHDDVGMLGSAALYKSAQKLMYGNQVYATELMAVLDAKFDPAQEWGFFAGSIFWARMTVFQPVVEQQDSLNQKLQDNAEMKTGTVTSVFHAMERVLGALPKITGMRTALSFATDLDNSSHAIYVPADERQYCSPVGIGMSLQNEHYLVKNLEKLHKRPGFDADYYLENTPLCGKLGMRPDLHFLRYGIYLNQAPDSSFSPFSYWHENPDVLRKRFNSYIHYLSSNSFGRKNTSLPPENNYHAAMQLLKQSRLFDAGYYLDENPDVYASGIKPLEHYCRYGWKEGRRPSLEFDPHWYQKEYLRHALAPVNPLLHYLLLGKPKGLQAEPCYSGNLRIQDNCFPANPKRACLFAAYDPDGLVDESVVIFVRELSRHAEVYFLSDATLQKNELAKLAPYVKAAWGIKHGEYDFGSYKRLAKYLVGWEKLAEYDEILLVNDSSYLLRPLDDVFSKMNAKSCCWWGLQATKGMAHTKQRKSNKFLEKIPMETVKQELLQAFVEEPDCDFHLGSYFLAFRKPLIDSGELRRLLHAVRKEHNKKAIILNNEVGLTRALICLGYDFDTYMDDLYPFHPVFSNHVFAMIEEGFPLFKRFFLSENHYHESDLWRWQEKLLKLIPKLDLKPITENLHRVVDAGKLYNNLHIQETPAKLMSHSELVRADKQTSKDMNCWSFPVCAYDHLLTGNDRAVFEEVKNDQNIKKIILFRSKHIALDGKNVHLVPLESLAGQRYLLESGVIFIKHTVRENVVFPLDPQRHKFIDLWHGIPLKRIGVASLDLQGILPKIIAEHKKLHCVIASSEVDRRAMAEGFYPLTADDVWVTGLPRNDFILRKQELLPADFQSQMQKLATMLAGKKFILFAPTFRNNQEAGSFNFSVAEKAELHAYLQDNDIVLGIREHMAARGQTYFESLQGSAVLNVGTAIFPNIEVLYRQAELLITDYSSCFIDFMLTGKAMISFAYDYENYKDSERGFFYDLTDVFPGAICHDFATLMQGIDAAMKADFHEPPEEYQKKRRIFFDYLDDHSAARLVKRIVAENKQLVV